MRVLLLHHQQAATAAPLHLLSGSCAELWPHRRCQLVQALLLLRLLLPPPLLLLLQCRRSLALACRRCCRGARVFLGQ
jgi:hypothetical protein